MKAQDLFTLILKIAGLYLIKDVILSVIPVIVYVLQLRHTADPNLVIYSLLGAFVTLALHAGIVYFLLFETKMLIRKLHLTSDLSEEPLVINLHRSAVLTIAIIVTGLLILVFAGYVNQSYDYTKLLIGLTEVTIGLVFLTNQRTIVNFIEYKRRSAATDEVLIETDKNEHE